MLESEYADYLEELFKSSFGSENVHREVHTPSDRFCDFLIETESSRYAIEVENTSEDIITNGVAQAILYAEELNAKPVVVFPSSSVKNIQELFAIASAVQVFPIPFEE